jgi:hypothetical protein
MKHCTYLFSFSILIISLLLILTPTSIAQAGGVIRVTTSGATTGSCGSSWGTPCDLVYALNSIAVSGDEIWVAAGVYKPTTSTTDMTAYIPLKAGVAIYGGFAGVETERTGRDPETNVTIFSGDIDGNDSQTPIVTDASTVTGYDTNSYHVIAGSADGATLDGVTITGGYGPYGCPYGWYAQYGGGLYVEGAMTINDVVFSGNRAFYGAALYNTSPVTITNSTFTGNYATASGGMFNAGGASTLTDVTFTNNRAVYDGAGMKSGGGPTLTNVTFTDNYAGTNAGGFYVNGSATLTDVTFTHNHGGNLGGGMTIEGASLVTLDRVTFTNNYGANSGGGLGAWSGYAILNDVTFSGNSSAADGGAISECPGGGNWTLNNVLMTGNTTGSGGAGISTCSPTTFNNVTLVNNTATDTWGYGSAIMNMASSGVTFNNSIIWGNTDGYNTPICSTDFAGCGPVTINHSDVQGGWGGTGNLNVDPLLGTLADNGGSVQSRALPAGSPAIDAGDASTCLSTDQRGELRNDLGCDLGAYERVFTDGDTVHRQVSSTGLTTFGPALAGIQRDPAYTDPGVITVTKVVSPSSGLESIGAHWTITSTETSGISVTLMLCYTDDENNSLSLGNLRFWRYHAGAWDPVGGTPTTSRDSFGNNCAQISGVDGFSVWTMASSKPTAVNFTRFRAVPNPRTGWAWAFGLSGVLGIAALVVLGRRRHSGNSFFHGEG